jgi:hypothetical protein
VSLATVAQVKTPAAVKPMANVKAPRLDRPQDYMKKNGPRVAAK